MSFPARDSGRGGLETEYMCNPISIIMSADAQWTPPLDGWVHSHEAIREANHLPDGEWGDRYARVEVRPPRGVFRDPATNEVLPVDDTWTVVLDEERAPGWWADDRPAQEARARDIAARWLRSFPAHLVPGHRAMGGDGSTLTGGDDSTITGGNYSTLTGGNYSTLTGGDGSTITGGNDSTLTGGDDSVMQWRIWDGARWRMHTVYVGEGGIEPGTAYTWRDGKAVKA